MCSLNEAVKVQRSILRTKIWIPNSRVFVAIICLLDCWPLKVGAVKVPGVKVTSVKVTSVKVTSVKVAGVNLPGRVPDDVGRSSKSVELNWVDQECRTFEPFGGAKYLAKYLASKLFTIVGF